MAGFAEVVHDGCSVLVALVAVFFTGRREMVLSLAALRRAAERVRCRAGRTSRDGFQSSPLSAEAARGRFGRDGPDTDGAD